MPDIRSPEQPVKAETRTLRLTMELFAAANDVVSAADVFDIDDVKIIDLDLVFLEFERKPDKQRTSSINEGEQLVYEIIAYSDPGAADYGIEISRALSREVIVPMSAFFSKLLKEAPEVAHGVLSSLARFANQFPRMGPRLDRLLNECAEQRSKEYWSGVAKALRRVNELLTQLAHAQEVAKRLQVKLAKRNLTQGDPPNWMSYALPVGPVVRSRNTIRMKLDKFFAGGAVDLCRRITSVKLAGACFLVSAPEIEQMLRYDRLLNMTDRMCFHLSQDEGGPLALPKFERNFERLVEAKRGFLEELETRLRVHSLQASYDPRRPGQIPPRPPLPAETTKPQEIEKSESKPAPKSQSAPKQFKIVFYTVTDIEVHDGQKIKKVKNRDTKRALRSLRYLAGETPRPHVTFSTKNLVDVEFPERKDINKLWGRYRKRLKSDLKGVRITGGSKEYTIYGLQFDLQGRSYQAFREEVDLLNRSPRPPKTTTPRSSG